jgi:hypothetical protein
MIESEEIKEEKINIKCVNFHIEIVCYGDSDLTDLFISAQTPDYARYTDWPYFEYGMSGAQLVLKSVAEPGFMNYADKDVFYLRGTNVGRDWSTIQVPVSYFPIIVETVKAFNALYSKNDGDGITIARDVYQFLDMHNHCSIKRR